MRPNNSNPHTYDQHQPNSGKANPYHNQQRYPPPQFTQFYPNQIQHMIPQPMFVPNNQFMNNQFMNPMYYHQMLQQQNIQKAQYRGDLSFNNQVKSIPQIGEVISPETIPNMQSFQPTLPSYPQPHLIPRNMDISFLFQNNNLLKKHENNNSGTVRNQTARKKEEKPPMSKENIDEIQKWIEERKRNYPTNKNIQRKLEEKKLKEETGELFEPSLSKLELKLRKKIKVLSNIENRSTSKREKEKAYLLRSFISPTTVPKETKFKKEKPNKKQVTYTDAIYQRSELPDSPTVIINDDGLVSELDKKRKEINAELAAMDLLKQFQSEIDKLDDEKLNKKEDTQPMSAPVLHQKIKSNGHTIDNKVNVEDSHETEGDDGPLVNGNIKIDPMLNLQNENFDSNFQKDRINNESTQNMSRNKRKESKKKADLKSHMSKAETIDEIIENLETKANQENTEIMNFLSKFSHETDYKYQNKNGALLTNLLIDSIYN